MIAALVFEVGIRSNPSWVNRRRLSADMKVLMPTHCSGIAVAGILSLGFLANATAAAPAASAGSGVPDAPINVAGTQTPSSDAVETASYEIGLVFGSQLASNGLGSTLSRESLVRGIDEALGGKIPSPAQKESAQQFIRAARTSLAAHNTERARLFLEKNAHESGIQTLPSGVQYRVLAPGDPTAPLPGPRDQVTLRYRASLVDGTEIDRSDDHSQAAVFRLNSVIKGWHEALSAMRPGAKWQVFVPPELGYGANPPPPIPPGALVVYELELLRVEAGTPTLPDRGPPVPRQGDSEVAPKIHAPPSSPAK